MYTFYEEVWWQLGHHCFEGLTVNSVLVVVPSNPLVTFLAGNHFISGEMEDSQGGSGAFQLN